MVKINFDEKNNSNFFFVFSNVEAASISDYEVESLINNYLSLIKSNNNINKSIKFSVILDENPNAFIDEKGILYITTGLLKYAPSYEAMIGILAHELGHIENYHITKRIDAIKNLKSINKLSTLSIIATSLLANNPNYLFQSMIANQVSIRNYYSSFSREQEREADLYAAQTLNQLQISSKSLKSFLKLLEKKSFQKGYNEENFRFSSHPVYKERYDILNNISNKQQHVFDKKLNARFNFVKSKIFGFTENNSGKLNEYLNHDYYDYANSIILSRKGKLKDSLIILNNIIKKYPENFFLIETKADLLLAHGYSNEALKFYQIVFSKDNKNHYVKKRIFEIKYEKTVNTNNSINFESFDNFSNLIMIFDRDIILLKKFKNTAKALKKDEWVNFIDANILLNKKFNGKALEKFESILTKSKDKKLINYTKQKIRFITNE